MTFAYEHILGIEIQTITKRAGLVTEKLKGFHHDYLNFFENSGVVNLSNKVICSKTGVIKADVCWNGKWFNDKTFFPSTWTQEKVIQKISGSITNIIDTPILQPNGNFLVKGKTYEGLIIESLIDQTTSKVITAYPKV